MKSIKTEFTTFRIEEGMEETAEQWMRVLIQRKDEVIDTLEREKMYFESIFKYYRDRRLYFSWFSIQSSDGEFVESSPHGIDKIHLEYWDKCIDRSFKPEDMEHVVSFIPLEVMKVIKHRHNAML